MKCPAAYFLTTVFTLVILYSLIFKITNTHLSLLSPLTHDKIFQSILPKLDKIPNDFVIKTPSASFIPQAEAAATFDVAASPYSYATAYVAIDNISGDVLLEKNQTQPVSIASLTKIMTAVVALDLVKPEDMFTISENASLVEPTIIGVVPGEKMTVEELLHAMLMTSANDAAQVISEGIDKLYRESVFIRAMNEKANEIGLKNSRFDNPQGFDSNHNYSSAYDLALLAHYAVTHYPLIADIVKKDYVLLPASENHKQFDLYNWNGLLDVYPNISGIKIGNTNSAGSTMIVQSQREGKSILAVVLGAPGILQRDLWTSELLDDAYQKEWGLSPIGVTEWQLREKYAMWKYGN